MRTPFSVLTILTFFISTVISPLPVYAADDLHLPAPGVMVPLSPLRNPPLLKGIKVHPENPFRFDFILDQGQSELTRGELREESATLVKYFLASLTIPDKDLWVNLSPYEKQRIIPRAFGLTEMGRDLLAQDYLLKQITASLIYPEGLTGKRFWKSIYEQAGRKFGTTDITVSTFNKVWIVPEKAVIYENAQAGTAYVVDSRLKVMLEQDYLALSHAQAPTASSALGSKVVREIVLPQLTREINEGNNFARLRQVYHSLILATWYKSKIKSGILDRVYTNQSKVRGIGYKDKGTPQLIYQRYLQAFKKGVYNYIKEESDPSTDQMIPRKYFSGGLDMAMSSFKKTILKTLPQLPSWAVHMNHPMEVEVRIDPAARFTIPVEFPLSLNRAMATQTSDGAKHSIASAPLSQGLLVPTAADIMFKQAVIARLKKLMGIPRYKEDRWEVGFMATPQGIPFKETTSDKGINWRTGIMPLGSIGMHNHPDLISRSGVINYQKFLPSPSDWEMGHVLKQSGEVIVWGNEQAGYFATMLTDFQKAWEHLKAQADGDDKWKQDYRQMARDMYTQGFIRFYRLVDPATGQAYAGQVLQEKSHFDFEYISLDHVLKLYAYGALEAQLKTLKQESVGNNNGRWQKEIAASAGALKKMEADLRGILPDQAMTVQGFIVNMLYLRSNATIDGTSIMDLFEEALKAASPEAEALRQGMGINVDENDQIAWLMDRSHYQKFKLFEVKQGVMIRERFRELLENKLLEIKDKDGHYRFSGRSTEIEVDRICERLFVPVVVEVPLTKTVHATIKHGLHARPAAEIVKYCNSLNGIHVYFKNHLGKSATGNSIMDLMILGISQDQPVEITVDGGTASEKEEVMKKIVEILTVDHPKNQAMAAKTNTGGIDLTAARTPLEVHNAGKAIRLKLDPRLLAQLQHTDGFLPVIVHIQPLIDVQRFLGLNRRQSLNTHEASAAMDA